MNIRVGVFAATLALGLSVPAAAQDPDWVRDLERRMARVTARAEARLEAQDQQREQMRRRREEALRRREEMARQRQEIARRRREARRQGPGLTEQFSKTARLGRDGTFELTNVAGDVVITGGGGDDVRIDATKRVWYPNDADARALLHDLQIEVTERTGVVEVRTTFPDRRRRDFSAAVDYTIGVPNGSSVVVRAISGDLRITNVRGELRAETVSGNVVLSSLGRLRSLKSVSGDIQIDDAEGTEVTVSTVSGTVKANNLKTRSVDLTSVSGDVRFAGVDSERVNLRSLSGDVDYSGRLTRSGRYELQSHSGNIRMAPSNPGGFDIEAATFNGDVRSDFALTLGGNLAGGRRGGLGSRTIRGSFGNGGSSLLLRSFSGDIEIVRQ